MVCVDCGKKHKNSVDPDFCSDCYDRIEKLSERNTMMNRASAARTYLSGKSDSLHYRQMEVFAFLSICNPRMSEKRKLEVIKAVE